MSAQAQSVEDLTLLFKAAPGMADQQVGCGGFAVTTTRSTLLETLDPSLETPHTRPAPGLWGSAYGTGKAMYGFGSTFFLWSKPTEGEVSAWQIPGVQGHYFSGLNVLSYLQDTNSFGIAPGVVLQGGIGGGVQSELEKQGQVYFMDAAHIHAGVGLGLYARRSDDWGLSIYGGYMPKWGSLLTLGFVEGDGRFDPDYLGTDQYDTDQRPNAVPTVLEYIMVTSNDIDVRRDMFLEARMNIGAVVFISYSVRRYDLSGAAGHELRDDSQWTNVRHTLGLGFGGIQ
jgi:hypothetical protein